jgi:hypothetical protein
VEEFPPSNLEPDPHREIFASRLFALRDEVICD